MALLLIAVPLQAAGGGRGNVQSDIPALNQPLTQGALKLAPKSIFLRLVQARIFQSGSWTLSSSTQTPVTVGRTIASCQPSFVTGLIRLPLEGFLSNAEVDAFNAVRSGVTQGSKDCRFDVVLNIAAEHSTSTVIERMRDTTIRIHPDAWTFFVSPETKLLAPDVFEAGIEYAHSLRQMVGYDGPLSLIPEGVDFIVVRAWDLKVNRKQIEALRSKQRVPVIVQLPTSFGDRRNADAVTYMDKMNTADRAALLTVLAENQNSWGYRLAYPVFYPLDAGRKAFDATKDSTLLVTIRSLMARFD